MADEPRTASSDTSSPAPSAAPEPTEGPDPRTERPAPTDGTGHATATPGPAPGTDPNHWSHPDHPEHGAWVRILREAAIEAEFLTGRREATEEEARHALHVRLARMAAGFVIIGLGIAALPLPGPGWLIIIFGLSLLPFAWAERTIRLIRRRIPGVPEEGRIPTRTWLVMITVVVLASAIGIVYGDAFLGWISGLWGDPDSLFG